MARPSDFEDARSIGGRLGTTNESLDAGNQFTRTEGLGDVIVGAHFQANHAVGFIAASREHQDGKAIQRFVLADFAANVQAGKFREHQIEQQQIGRRLLQSGEAAGAVEGGADLKTFICKVVPDELDDVAIVFNDQDALHVPLSNR